VELQSGHYRRGGDGAFRFMSGAGPARAVLGPRVEGGSRRVHAAQRRRLAAGGGVGFGWRELVGGPALAV
jgi:hypothetical protein